MNRAITISREYGSGGREIGEKLARRLGIPFYDKELIAMIAKEGNIETSVLEANDEVDPDFDNYSPRQVPPAYLCGPGNRHPQPERQGAVRYCGALCRCHTSGRC